ncbi:hypothetical protein ACFYU9_02275 [Streptomyces sp. NPDC004327]|uniref:hypothetical protein n=1 Tax=Streptomyces sp. NPDC004327 TaxID=3364699 RepID=UPI0036A0926B
MDGRERPPEQTPERLREQADWRADAAHKVVMAVLFAVPMLKLSWTLGGGSQARAALDTMGPKNWLDVVVGMFLFEPLLSTVLGVVATHASYVAFTRRGGAAAHRGRRLPALLASAAIVPAALALVVGALNGWAWGLTAGLLAYAMRLGVLVDEHTGRYVRSPAGPSRRRRPAGALQHGADVLWAAGLVLSLAVLPFLSLAAALDGRSWTGVVHCDVNTGSGTHRDRLIELERQGDGVVGWAVAGGGVVNGLACAGDADDVIRQPWWRS